MELGGDFRGAKTETIYFYKLVERRHDGKSSETEDNDKTTPVRNSYPILKSYNVIHISSIRGIDSRMEAEAMSHPENVRDAYIDDAVRSYLYANGVTLHHSPYSQPSYSETTDTVQMPLLEQFESTEAYYAAIMHTLVLSAASKGRCDWSIKGGCADKRSRTELAAEMAAVLLCNHFELDTIGVFDNSVAYIRKWIDELKADKHLITWAAAKAEKAASYILSSSQAVSIAA